MTDTYELNEASEALLPEGDNAPPDNIPDGNNSLLPEVSSRNSDNKKNIKYDDTAEIGKILETVLSAQSAKDQAAEPAPDVSEDSVHLTPSESETETPQVKSQTCIPHVSEESPPSLSPKEKTGFDTGIGDSSPVDKVSSIPIKQDGKMEEEYALLKELLSRKNQLLSTGFGHINSHLKQIRSYLDQLQSFVDKISRESLKDVLSPVPDQAFWPKYSLQSGEESQWTSIISEVEKMVKKFPEPSLSLEVGDWPAHSPNDKAEGSREWDNTLVHLRRAAQDKKEREQTGALKSRESLREEILSRPLEHREEDIREDHALRSFGQVRESLRRIQNLVDVTSPRGEELPMREALEPEDQERTFYTKTKPRTEKPEEEPLSRGETLIYRQHVKDLKHPDLVVRVKSAEILAESRLKSTPEILIDAWCDEQESEVRSTIIKALVKLDYKEAISFFTDALEENDVKVQMAALEGLYKFGTSQATAGLLRALRSRFYHIRRRAVTYIGWNKIEMAYPQLIKMLKDENDFVRKATISALYSLQNKESIPHLIETLHDSSSNIRKKTLELLYRWTGLQNNFIVDAPGSERLKGIERWKEWWKKQGQTFQISRIYRVETDSVKPPSPPIEQKESLSTASPQVAEPKKPEVADSSPVTTVKTHREKAKKADISPAIAKTRRRRPRGADQPDSSPRKPLSPVSEHEHLVLASDISPELIAEDFFSKKSVPKKKDSQPRPITEKVLEKAISKAPDGITLKELAEKFEVKWQTLSANIKKLVQAGKITKTKNKYFPDTG